MSSHKNGAPSKTTVASAATQDFGDLPPLGAVPSLMDALPAVNPPVMYKSVTAAQPMAADVQRAYEPMGFAKSTGGLAPLEGVTPLPALGEKLPTLGGLSIMEPAGLTAFSPAEPMHADLDPLFGFELPPCLVEVVEGPQPLPDHVIPHQCVTVCDVDAEQLVAELMELVLASGLEVALEARDKGVFAVKGSVVVNHNQADFAMDVFVHGEGAAIEFRRISGDPAAWHSFFIAMAVVLRQRHGMAKMLGGWDGTYPADEAVAELTPPKAFEPKPLSSESVDAVLAELAAHSEYSAEAMAELATQCDAHAVGDDIAQANIASLLTHAEAVDVLITHVLTFKRDAPALRGALCVLHALCHQSVEQQRRFVTKPLEILVKLVSLLEQAACDLVVQHAVKLMAVLASVVSPSTRWAPDTRSPASGHAWRDTIAKACAIAAKYAQPTNPSTIVTAQSIHDVRQLIASQC